MDPVLLAYLIATTGITIPKKKKKKRAAKDRNAAAPKDRKR
jgi:hypothetical protein